MALIKVKPQVGEIGSVFYPVFLDKYNRPMVLVYMGKIIDIDVLTGDILVKDAPFAVPEWRMQWFTFGGIPVQNPKFSLTKIENDNKMRLQKATKSIKRN
jgi:hypothetical protein